MADGATTWNGENCVVLLNRVCELEEQHYRNHERISDVSDSS